MTDKYKRLVDDIKTKKLRLQQYERIIDKLNAEIINDMLRVKEIKE